MPKKIKSSIQTILKQKTEIDLSDFKPKTIIPPKTNTYIALAILLFTLVIYQLTNAKSTSFWDAGEYISTSSFLGIPHPPGNPFYIVLGRFFCIISLGLFNHAAVISFLSSLSAALGVMLTYLLTVQLLSMWKEEKYLVFMGGFVAALLTAFSFSYWMNAVEAAVYATMACIINLCIWLTLVWVKKQEEFSDQNIPLLIIYLLFLGFGIHQTVFQIAPALLFIMVLPYVKDQFKTYSFWGKFVLYLAGLFVIYFMFSDIGVKYNVPVLSKFAFAAGIICIMYWYLREYISNKVWLLGIGLMLIGFSTHLFLYVRSEFRPFINEGHPYTWDLFMDYVLRKQFGEYNFLTRRAPLTYQTGYHFLRYMSWQFLDAEVIANWLRLPIQLVQVISNFIITFLGFHGFYYAYKKNKYCFWYLLSLFFMVSVAMIFVMNLSNMEVRDRDYFFVTAYNIWAVAIGIGAVGLINLVIQKKYLKYCIICLFLIYPFINMVSQYHKHDRTGEFIGLGYGLNILNSLEENAIVFTNGDNDTFPLWYAQSVKDKYSFEHTYPSIKGDEPLTSIDGLYYGIADDSLRKVYPTARTEQLLAGAAKWKASHINGIRNDVTVANLSLLNTPWYVKHLRDLEGVEINLTDSQIDNQKAIVLPREYTVSIASPKGDRFSITYPVRDTMFIKDFMVAQIIKDNYGKRPIYFAITCSNFSRFDNHLINEGMVSRVVHERGSSDRTDPIRLENNLENIYFYGGIFDEKLYRDDNMTRLVGNYGAAYLRLSDHYQTLGDIDRAVMLQKRALDFIQRKEEKIRFTAIIAATLAEGGKIEAASKMIDDLIADYPTTVTAYTHAAYVMFLADEDNKAFEYLERGLELDPVNRQLVQMTLQYGFERDKREEAYRILSKVAVHLPELRQYLPMLLDDDYDL